MLKIHILDSGKGIKEEEIQKLFTKFGKLRRTAEINSEGIGLGLMICKELVTLNHGTISVQSDGENKGSVFTFSMRMQLVNSDDPESEILKEYEVSQISGSSKQLKQDRSSANLEGSMAEFRLY